MGKPTKKQTAGSASDNDALSLHTTPDDYAYDDLPTYTDSETAAASGSDSRPLLDAPALNRHAYIPDDYAPLPNATPRPFTQIGGRVIHNETTSRMDKRLNDPYNLYAYVMDVVRMIPPKPMIHIMGQHKETTRDSKNSTKTDTVTDFDLYMNLQPLLRPALEKVWWEESVISPMDKAFRGSFRKTTAPGVTQAVQLTDETVPDLKEWCEIFCQDRSTLKVFRITRAVNGLDKAVLEQLIAGLIRSTEYRGHLNISFPVEGKYVDIYSPHWVNEWRTSWVRYLFYFSMLWIFTWPALYFMTKWYVPYQAVWHFSVTTDAEANDRKFAAMSERAWFERHAQYIKHLVLNRTQGEADSDPRVVESYNDRPDPAMASTGHAELDSAINVVAGGFNVWNQIRARHAPSLGAWGYDT